MLPVRLQRADERGQLLVLIATPARALRHAATLTASPATTATASAITTISSATTVTTTLTTAAVTSIAVAAVALHLVKAVIRVSSSCRCLLRFGVVISPRLTVDWGSSWHRSGARLGGLLRNLNINPLLRHGHVVAGIPLALSCRVSGIVSNIGIAGGRVGGRSLSVTIGKGLRGTLFDLSETGVGNCRVRLQLSLRFGRFGFRLCSGLGDEQRGGVSNRYLLDLCICSSLSAGDLKCYGSNLQVVCSVSPAVLCVGSSTPSTSLSMVATA